MRFIIGAVFGLLEGVFWICVAAGVVMSVYVLFKTILGL